MPAASQRLALAVVCIVAASSGAPTPGGAQHDHSAPHDSTGTLGIPVMRAGSGTAWLPDAARVPGYHGQLGRWALMAHGSVFVQYDRQFGTRADHQLGSTNWIMVAATRPVAGGTVRLRTMVSAEPLTLTERGYPQLLQVALPYRGATLTDRQHPHDLLSEASVAFERLVGSTVAVSLYTAPVGEPALGPVAYRHRPSAAYDPAAPLGHHTQDFTHTSFGVVTFGAFTRRMRLEGSWFNGAHADDVRTDLEGVRLDSYAGRLSLNPSRAWSVAAWFGHLAAAGGSHAHGALDRFGVSILHSQPRASGGQWSTTFVYGANLPAGAAHPLNTLLVETTFEVDRSNALFGRVEYVRRTAADLALLGSVSRELDIGAVSLGFERGLRSFAGLRSGLGARATLNPVPEELRLFYGSRTPAGVILYGQVRPGMGRTTPDRGARIPRDPPATRPVRPWGNPQHIGVAVPAAGNTLSRGPRHAGAAVGSPENGCELRAAARRLVSGHPAYAGGRHPRRGAQTPHDPA